MNPRIGQMLARSARWQRGGRPRCRVTMVTRGVRCSLILPPVFIAIGPALGYAVFNTRKVAANG